MGHSQPFVRRSPKIEFSQMEIVIFNGNYSTIFSRLWRLLGRLKNEKEEKEEKSKNKTKKEGKKSENQKNQRPQQPATSNHNQQPQPEPHQHLTSNSHAFSAIFLCSLLLMAVTTVCEPCVTVVKRLSKDKCKPRSGVRTITKLGPQKCCHRAFFPLPSESCFWNN